ncbi:hydroxymethylglutaryl-CoA lyase [Piscibacillus halophilus]|uniref:Hydroxymethylglutaryl-CoA lyase n=1 Tax=Piscibacillus halophilus TaxID=571933 RepID=A0A1H9I836_9BACI|nr:hydroxymethylglutaryl-CoA lyase [Piscibacillus halophilus]SEQ70740.1 hydroxymethylglutaryl-CoA lyase [Piscibacillus halophilus]
MKEIKIQEVMPRDGLQNEPLFVPTEKKVDLINRLSQSGVSKIEVTSFVSPKAIPNLKDAEDVMTRIDRNPNVIYSTLVPNLKGAERAVQCKVDEINLLVSASNTHNLENVRRTTSETFDNFNKLIDYLSDYDVILNGSLGTTFGCPFEGHIPQDRIFELVESYLKLNVKGITLADTTGMATPNQVYDLCSELINRYPEANFTLHFHNTRGMGLANVLEGIRAGITQFDSSLGGVGGCPFAPGASGNICTEDLVHMLHFMGYQTNVDLDLIINISKQLQDVLQHELPGQIIKAGKITDLHNSSISN